MYPTTIPFDLALPDEPLLLDLRMLYQQFQTLPDQRKRRGVRYPGAVLLLIAVLAKLTGHSRVRALADWARLRAIFVLSYLSVSCPDVAEKSRNGRMNSAPITSPAIAGGSHDTLSW